MSDIDIYTRVYLENLVLIEQARKSFWPRDVIRIGE